MENCPMEMHTRLVCGSKRMGSSKASAMPAGTPVTAAQSQQFPQEQSTMRAHSSSGSTAETTAVGRFAVRSMG